MKELQIIKKTFSGEKLWEKGKLKRKKQFEKKKFERKKEIEIKRNNKYKIKK